jgi:hypothetical protein
MYIIFIEYNDKFMNNRTKKGRKKPHDIKKLLDLRERSTTFTNYRQILVELLFWWTLGDVYVSLRIKGATRWGIKVPPSGRKTKGGKMNSRTNLLADLFFSFVLFPHTNYNDG